MARSEKVKMDCVVPAHDASKGCRFRAYVTPDTYYK